MKASPVDHVALALDVMDIDNAEDFELTEEESKQQFGSVVSSNDISIAVANTVPHNTMLTKSWAHSINQVLIRSSIANYDTHQLKHPTTQAITGIIDRRKVGCSEKWSRAQPETNSTDFPAVYDVRYCLS